jgi:hypothetical protein
MNLELDFNNKGNLFIPSLFSVDKINEFNKEFRNFLEKNNIYTHLKKRHDVVEDTYFVNNTYTSLNTFQKMQYYYLPVIDNRLSHNRTTDDGMVDFFNVEKLFPNIYKTFDLEILLSILKKITNRSWKLFRTNIHLCNNVKNSSSFHIDNAEECIKCTIYLSDVLTNDHGPPVYIEGSHNNINSSTKTQNKNIKIFLGGKGDVLFSYQNGIHRKLSQNNCTTGFLVFNFISMSNNKLV